eukprot:g41081.t1
MELEGRFVCILKLLSCFGSLNSSEDRLRRGDDLRLQMALEESRRNSAVVVGSTAPKKKKKKMTHGEKQAVQEHQIHGNLLGRKPPSYL